MIERGPIGHGYIVIIPHHSLHTLRRSLAVSWPCFAAADTHRQTDRQTHESIRTRECASTRTHVDASTRQNNCTTLIEQRARLELVLLYALPDGVQPAEARLRVGVAFRGRLFVPLEGHAQVTHPHAFADLVHEPEVVHGTWMSLLRALLEPLHTLLLVHLDAAALVVGEPHVPLRARVPRLRRLGHHRRDFAALLAVCGVKDWTPLLHPPHVVFLVQPEEAPHRLIVEPLRPRWRLCTTLGAGVLDSERRQLFDTGLVERVGARQLLKGEWALVQTDALDEGLIADGAGAPPGVDFDVRGLERRHWIWVGAEVAGAVR